jgi:hypothetical protein
MVYAQYAVMGGFAADIQHIHNAITERVTITTDGILFLARHGFFCRIRKDDIQDKSKADILAKGLVCVQVLWVAGEAIERKIAGYPITLLEVHTLVHVVCAIIMYALWIRKPLNVKDPTMLDFRDASDILAFMVEKSRQSYKRGSLQHRPGFNRVGLKTEYYEPLIWWYKDPRKEPVQMSVDDPRGRLEIGSPLESRSRDPTQELIQISTLYSCTHKDVDGVTHYYGVGSTSINTYRYVPVSNFGTVCEMVSGQASSLGYGPEILGCDGNEISITRDHTLYPTQIISLSEKDIIRLNESTAEFLTKVKVTPIGNPTVSEYPYDKDVVSLDIAYKSYTGLTSLGNPLSLQPQNFNGVIFEDIDSDTAYLVTAMAMIPAAYGCAHIGALSLTFPSSVERLLWTISCYYLIAAAVACGILGLLTYTNRIIWRKWDVDIYKTIRHILAYSVVIIFDHGRFMEYLGAGIVLAIFGSIALVYVGARLYIVVESFISLRHVPIGVYDTPAVNFMNYIPHL